MKKTYIYAAWVTLYCLCVALGFVPNPQGFGKFLLTVTGFIFFLPPFYLLYLAKKENSRKTLLVLRLLSIVSLSVSLVLLILNLLSVYFSQQTGLVLHVLLVMFTAPMGCIRYWVLSLFLWACLLMLTRQKRPPCQR